MPEPSFDPQSPTPDETATPTGPLGAVPLQAADESGAEDDETNEPTVTLSTSMLPPGVREQMEAWGGSPLGAAAVQASPAQQYTVRRDLRVEYTRHVYRQRACYVNVRVGPEAMPLPPQTQAERREFAASDSSLLEFQAGEIEPVVKVQLEFDDAAFTSHRTSEVKALKRSSETRFEFVLLPLRAEDANIRVNISYVHNALVPEQVTATVVKLTTIVGEDGRVHTTREEQSTVTPAHVEREETVVRSLPLVVSVKSLLRLNASEVGLVQKGLGIAVTCVLLFLGVQNGQLSTVPYAIMSLAPLAGVPIGDATVKLFERIEGH